MRAILGPVAVHGMLVFAGLGVLSALGALERSRRGVLAGIGMAYFTGVAAVMLASIALLVVGGPFSAGVVIAISAVVGLVGFALRRPSARTPESTATGGRWERAAGLAALALFAVYSLVGFMTAAVTPLGGWDSWSLWTRKAIVIADAHGLPLDYFASSTYGSTHLDYPLLLPLLEAAQFDAAGRVDLLAIHLEFWLLLVFFVWAIASLVVVRVRPVIWIPIVLAAAVCPGVYQHLLSAYADVPMGFFLGLAVLLLGSWLAEGRRAHVALAALFLAAAANTKNEGLMAAACALGAGAIVLAAAREWRAFRSLALAGTAFLLMILPWRLWLSAHDVEGDLPVASGLNPAFLADRAERVPPAAGALHEQIAAEPRWFLLVPVAAALCSLGLLRPSGRRIPAFYLLTGTMIFSMLVWAYWISPAPLGWHLATSVDRVVAGLFFVAVAAMVQVAGQLAGEPVAHVRPRFAALAARIPRPRRKQSLASPTPRRAS